MLFPGTGALQTRARYFFFVPWMHLDFEAARVSSVEVARKGRAFEIGLIDRLADSSDPAGTIGIQARSSLQRIPSSIYWNGLKLLRICQFPGSQAEYHRSLDRQVAAGAAVRRNDDGEVVGGVGRAWHAGLPAAPSAFPSQVSFTLTVPEARYLKERVLENHRQSLFAFMLDRDYVDADAEFAWEHPASQQAPVELRRQIEHARCFSEVMHGAAILYNLPDVTLRCWPATVTSSVGVSFDRLEQGKVAAKFPGLSFQAITSFFAFELTGRAGGEERQVRFVVNVPLVGAPEGRREQVLRSLVRDRSRMMRFLWLLLADEGVAVPEVATMNRRESESSDGGSSLLTSGLFEMLLRNLDRAPARLDHMSSLLKALRQGADGEDLLPPGFDAIWEPIWRQRERLRSRSEA